MRSNQFLALSNLVLKVASGKNILKLGLLELRSIDLFISSYLLRRYISSKVESSVVEDIKMAAGFGGVREYGGRLIFMDKVTLKIRSDVSLRGGGRFMKNVAVMFSSPKSIYK